MTKGKAKKFGDEISTRRQAPDRLLRRSLKVSSPRNLPLRNGQRYFIIKAVCYRLIVAYFEEFPLARSPQCVLPYPAFQLLFVAKGFVMVCRVPRPFCPNSGEGVLTHQTR